MFIKSLKIECDTHTIRNIVFHKGVNFIVDESKLSASEHATGNNIGKTTVLRLINFCLGGSEKSIYQSKEFKTNINEKVRKFLIEREVKITLTLKENLDELMSREVKIVRNFLSGSKKLLEINDEKVKVKDLDLELKKHIFEFDEEKPTFNQIKAKNIRDDAERLENTIKVLGSFAKLEEYEALYLFWLGVEYPDAEKKRILIEKRNLEDRIYQRLVSEDSESKIQQFISIINHEIEDLENLRNEVNRNPNYKEELDKVNETRSLLNNLYSEHSRLSLRKDLIVESFKELEKSIVTDESKIISELYKQAKIFIPNLERSYTETVRFHNEMIAEKIDFIFQEIPDIENKIAALNSRIQTTNAKEVKLSEKLEKKDKSLELMEILTEINLRHEDKGRLIEKEKQILSSKKILKYIDRKLGEINDSLSNLDKKIQKRISEFNIFFSEISYNLYGERFALSASYEKKKDTEQYFYKLHIDSLDGQTGTGKKKGEIAAFDISYIKFADKMKISCLHFILHDQIEIVDDNQISVLVKEAINANCQFIAPILRDKLPGKLIKPEYIALSLSQKSKLFMI